MNRVSLHWRAILGLIRRLPQGLISRITGRLAGIPVPAPLRTPVIGGFAKLAGIRVDEAEAPPESYPSVGAFFVRRLRAGARVWDEPEGLPGSPVDGVVGAIGTIDGDSALQAKGMRYSVMKLLAGLDGGDRGEFWWEGGRFLTIYLSPRHYHRIHVPVGAEVTGAVSVPGGLLPVNDAAVRSEDGLFVTNERLVVQMEAEGGPLALVAVGAFNVGRISTTFEPAWADGATNRGGRGPGAGVERRDYSPPIALERGEELAAFHLGSTVVLIFGPEWERTFAPNVLPGEEIRMGQALMEPRLEVREPSTGC
ncbi:MAG: phosphatidylserine decarboxylase [Gemmatimonadales bacterium]|nr:MAG: phosphatidylserine decarboxylase [Gemmatimonadales bacterium]